MHSSEGQVVFNILVRREKTESLLNILQKHFSKTDGFRISLVPVEASIPVPESLI